MAFHCCSFMVGFVLLPSCHKSILVDMSLLRNSMAKSGLSICRGLGSSYFCLEHCCQQTEQVPQPILQSPQNHEAQSSHLCSYIIIIPCIQLNKLSSKSSDVSCDIKAGSMRELPLLGIIRQTSLWILNADIASLSIVYRYFFFHLYKE